MTTYMKRAPQTKVGRQIVLLRPAGPGGLACVRLTVGKDSADYLIRRIESQIGGEAFEVVKVGETEPGEGRYHVLLKGEHSTCECKGHLRWSAPRVVDGVVVPGTVCRHIWGCERASARGWL